MPFETGNTLSTGRPQGSRNKPKKCVAEICEELGFDPFQFLALVGRGEDQALGFQEGTITLDHRMKAAILLAPHISPTLKAVAVSGSVDIGADEETKKQVEHLKSLFAKGTLKI